ncbi:hypothetical protein GHT06_021094 [Daphnia sinensis]|uniref:Uncharacterized protein n=1 Tax=Daphnia sinensis TaxID=1820382 RepID=A0AAD5PS82_9CRUS|nr:hypothetical protein GHT06_021094 [Daphnia sinensis]
MPFRSVKKLRKMNNFKGFVKLMQSGVTFHLVTILDRRWRENSRYRNFIEHEILGRILEGFVCNGKLKHWNRCEAKAVIEDKEGCCHKVVVQGHMVC